MIANLTGRHFEDPENAAFGDYYATAQVIEGKNVTVLGKLCPPANDTIITDFPAIIIYFLGDGYVIWNSSVGKEMTEEVLDAEILYCLTHLPAKIAMVSISEIHAPSSVSSKAAFIINITVTNHISETVKNVSAKIELPEGFSLSEEKAEVFLGDLMGNESRVILWSIVAGAAGLTGKSTHEFKISVISEGEEVSSITQIIEVTGLNVMALISAISVFGFIIGSLATVHFAAKRKEKLKR